MTHAFFKACLFLGAGSVMHGMHEDTDIRNMGGLWSKMPHTAKTFGIATLAITGIVPLSGFFSKDAILARRALQREPRLAGRRARSPTSSARSPPPGPRSTWCAASP